MKKWTVSSTMALLLVSGCAVTTAAQQTVIVYAYSLPSDSVTAAYEIETFEDGLIKRIVRYQAVEDVQSPGRDELYGDSFRSTAAYLVTRTSDSIEIGMKRQSEDSVPDVRITGLPTGPFSLFFDGNRVDNLDFSYDQVASRVSVAVNGDSRIALSRSSTETTILIPSTMNTFQYSGGRLISFETVFRSSGSSTQVEVDRRALNEYRIVLGNLGEPVPYLRKFDIFAEPVENCLVNVALNLFLLNVLDRGDTSSYVIPFLAMPPQR